MGFSTPPPGGSAALIINIHIHLSLTIVVVTIRHVSKNQPLSTVLRGRILCLYCVLCVHIPCTVYSYTVYWAYIYTVYSVCIIILCTLRIYIYIIHCIYILCLYILCTEHTYTVVYCVYIILLCTVHIFTVSIYILYCAYIYCVLWDMYIRVLYTVHMHTESVCPKVPLCSGSSHCNFLILPHPSLPADKQSAPRGQWAEHQPLVLPSTLSFSYRLHNMWRNSILLSITVLMNEQLLDSSM